MKIAICHQTFADGDAIGRDIAGMYRTLEECGCSPFVLCQCNVARKFMGKVKYITDGTALRDVDLIIYHHSQDWPAGRTLLDVRDEPVVFKFHNITPPRFFSNYSPDYEVRCRLGEQLTEHLLHRQSGDIWLSASHYNRDALLAKHPNDTSNFVAPPFNQVSNLLGKRNLAASTDKRVRFLFAGRFVPNKGHNHVLRFAHAYRALFGPNFEITIVGARDPALAIYWHEFTCLVHELDLREHIHVFDHVSDPFLHELFRNAHAYISFSEHEGFCVPIIEAQAIGLPVVGSGATAVRETSGGGQFVGTAPSNQSDYEFYAELAHLAVRDDAVRCTLKHNGFRNVTTRFTDDVVENAFLEPILSLLLALR
ncbi:MAG: glycosyltransferase family 4 protein [Opitutaceae bacterium]